MHSAIVKQESAEPSIDFVCLSALKWLLWSCRLNISEEEEEEECIFEEEEEGAGSPWVARGWAGRALPVPGVLDSILDKS